jgi:hypothetical protein
MKCPFVLPESEISKEGNTRVNYADFGGSDYIFYDHDDGFGNITRVQFCQLIGRKRDVFECLNESEWHACRTYQSMQENCDEERASDADGQAERDHKLETYKAQK